MITPIVLSRLMLKISARYATYGAGGKNSHIQAMLKHTSGLRLRLPKRNFW
jgi:hypothetical protein